MEWFWRLLEWYKAYRLERLKIQAEAQAAPFVAISNMVAEMGKTNQATVAVIQQWMDGFKVAEASTSTVRDVDEVREELERLGFERPELHSTLDAAIKAGQFSEFKDIMNGLDL